MPVLTLLTDFGIHDEYVGLMKGVILSILPSATIVDLSHDVDPQDIVQAAYLITSSYGYFPEKTVHLVVVDPGVGGDRSIIAVKTKNHYFLVPDNGVLSLILDGDEPDEMVRVENTAYFLEPVSRTFHGRDIFAPVGAHIAKGTALRELGPLSDGRDLKRIPIHPPFITSNEVLIGEVVWIDRFGNLITNIDSHTLETFQKSDLKRPCRIQVGDRMIEGFAGSYDSVDPLVPLAVIGSRGYLEIAVNRGSARRSLRVGKGDRILVTVSQDV